PEDGVLTTSSLAPYIHSNGELTMIVMVTAGDRAVLNHLHVGEEEKRSTGLPSDQHQITPGERVQNVSPDKNQAGGAPPDGLFGSPVMPKSADLSGDFAPIGDQMQYGSCTAFAIAQGAFNYELGKIYRDLGWDFTKASNLASPKYLYLKCDGYD